MNTLTKSANDMLCFLEQISSHSGFVNEIESIKHLLLQLAGSLSEMIEDHYRQRCSVPEAVAGISDLVRATIEACP